MTSDYEKYAILEAQIEALNEQKDKYRTKIIDDMIARGEKNADTPVGKFTVAKIKTWTYTDELIEKESIVKDQIKELSEKVKALKAKEEETGDATYVEKPSLRFTSVKL